MSIGKLAEACGVSASTVTRFCTALGYRGYKEFQLDLAANLAFQTPSPLDAFGKNTSIELIYRYVFEHNRQSLAETERLIDKNVLVQVAQRIQKSKRTMIIGIGGSGLVAMDAAKRFTSVGVTAISLTDPYEAIFATGTTGPKDVVIGISHTGQTSIVIEGIEEARQRRSQTVALTNYPNSPLAEAAEFVLVTAYREHRINAAVSSSLIAQVCVIDALYFILGCRGSQTTERLSAAAENRVRNLLRAPKGRKPANPKT